MHVAYIHQHFSTLVGTTGTRSYEMSLRLLASGHRVSMICGAYASSDAAHHSNGTSNGHSNGQSSGQPNSRSNGTVQKSVVDGIDVLRVGEPYADDMGFAQRVRAFTRFARHAGRIVCDLRPDIVIASSTPLTVGLAGIKAKKRLGIPFVFEVRDLWPEVPIAIGALNNPLLRWYARRMEHRIYDAADRIIALSPGMRDGVCSTGYPPEHVALIPNACDLELFAPNDGVVNDPRFGDPKACRFLFAGAHGLVGGLDAILDALVELKRRSEHGIQVIFVGQGRERSRLIERSERDGIDDLIR